MRNILKSSAIMGGSSLVSILSGIVKNKLIALLLGPEGVGFLAILLSLQSSISIVAGMGLGQSTVRAVAAAASQNNSELLVSLRKISLGAALIFGLLFGGLIFCFRSEIAEYIINDRTYAWAVGWISLGVVATNISGFQAAWVQGFSRISDVAKITIWGSLGGTVIGIAALWWLGIKGIVFLVLATPISTLAASWWYASKVKTPSVKIDNSNFRSIFFPLVTLGVSIMFTSLMDANTLFAVRWLINDQLSIASVGYFQAAWSISMLYLGFVLSAMATDYYPRLAEVAADQHRLVGRVNEQAYVAMLLATPIILGVYVATPLIVELLYSNAFTETIKILRWQLLGDLFKVPAWSLSYVLLAQGKSLLHFFASLIWCSLYLAILWIGLGRWGLQITGVGFMLAYIAYLFSLWAILKKTVQFSWSQQNYKLMLITIACTLLVVISQQFFSYAWIFQLMVVVGLGLFSLLEIQRSLGYSIWHRLNNRL